MLSVLYAVSYTNSLCRNVSYSPKRFLNNSKSMKKGSVAHLVTFGLSFSAPQKIRTPVKLFVFSTQSTNAQLTQALCKLYGTRTSFNLKYLLTSRPYGGIRRGFQPLDIPGLPVIHLSGESDIEMKKISREIDIFIKARVHDIGGRLKLRNDEQELLLQKLMDVPNRTYLWVHLTLDLIESDINIDKTGIVKATSQLPKTVDEAYDRILSKSHDSQTAKRILHIIVAAAR
jgi:ankyrin repeat domain-containing protein 50